MRAMACLALTPERLVPTPELAAQTQVPVNYLAKVLQQLAGAGLISGRRGVGGGYKLARPASQIEMIEIIESIGRIGRINACPLGLENHGPNLCPMHRALDSAAKAVFDVLRGVTLQLGFIPLGGFVSVPQMAIGQTLEGKVVKTGKQLDPITPLDKMIIALGGPVASVLLAVFFAIFVWRAGHPVG